MAQTQAQTLAGALPPPPPPSGNDPQVIIPSALELTREQEDKLLQHARSRFLDLSSELGRADYEVPGFSSAPVSTLHRAYSTFFGRRYLSHLIYQQRMEWRSYVLGGIYAETNIHLPITTRIVGQQIARANKTFFGTSPFFAISGLSKDSDELAKDIDAMAIHFLDALGGVGASLENANELAFIQGETAVKTRHHKLSSYFESYRDVAVDGEDKPIVALDGDYIYKTDLFVAGQEPALDMTTQQPLKDEAGQPVMQESNTLVLKRDGQTPQPPVLKFKTVKVNLVKTTIDRVESKPIYFLDFLCPLNAPDIQQADCVIHCYNAQVIELADRYLRDQWGVSPEEQVAAVARLVSKVSSGSPDSKQAIGDRDRPEQGEYAMNKSIGRDRNEPVVGMAECWLHYDVFGDGVQRSIMLLMDQEGQVPIYYDYTANLTEDGLRPIDVVRINPVTNRWHGQGNVERFYSLQDQADLLINRAFFAESRAARVDFWDPSRTMEGEADPTLKLNWGGSYRLRAGEKAEDVLKSVYLTNIKSASLKDLLQTVLQTMQSMSAVTNVNDGAMAGLDTAKLATGIRNLESSGEELYHQYISHLRPCHESILRRALKVLIAHLLSDQDGKQKLIRFFDRATKRIVEIDPLRLQDLDLDVVLTLSTYDRQSKLQQSQLAYNMLSAYLQSIGATPEIMEERLGPLVSDSLRALQVRDPEQKTAPLPPEVRMQLQAAAMAPEPAGGGQIPAPTPENLSPV